MKQKNIPLRITKEDYNLWRNFEIEKEYQQVIKSMGISQLITPVLTPLEQQGNVLTEQNRALNASALYYFFGKKDISAYNVLCLNSNLSYYSRIFYRLGVAEIYSVEERDELFQLGQIINKLEYCDKIQMCKRIPVDMNYDIVMYCNDDKESFIEELYTTVGLCKKYFIICSPSDEMKKASWNSIMSSHNFSTSYILNKTLIKGNEWELIVFEKQYQADF